MFKNSHATYDAHRAGTLSMIPVAPMCKCGNAVDSDCAVGFNGIFTFRGWKNECLTCHVLADVAKYGCE